MSEGQRAAIREMEQIREEIEAGKTPERIWVSACGKALVTDHPRWDGDVEYILKSIHDISQTERHADGEYIGHLQARVEELEAALPQWRDIEGHDAEYGEAVLGAYKTRQGKWICEVVYLEYAWVNAAKKVVPVTHYQTLPTPTEQ